MLSTVPSGAFNVQYNGASGIDMPVFTVWLILDMHKIPSTTGQIQHAIATRVDT